MNVRVGAARRQDLALARDDFGARADDDIDTGLNIRVARLADPGDPSVQDRDISLYKYLLIDDQRVGYDCIDRALGLGEQGLSHAVADDLAATEFHLIAINGEILLNLDDQIGVSQPGQDFSAGLHQVRHAASIAGAFHDEVGDQRDGFRSTPRNQASGARSTSRRRSARLSLNRMVSCGSHSAAAPWATATRV